MYRRDFLLGVTSLPLGLREPVPSIEQRVFKAINFQRVSDDAEALIWSNALAVTSRAHSSRMLNAGFFGHEDPVYGGLSARLTSAGLVYRRCGENVFREKNFDDPVSIAIVEWMYSEGHRNNLLLPEFTHSGVGVAVSGDGTVAVTQQFLTPRPQPK
jgi:uncharacterized protein YkwD